MKEKSNSNNIFKVVFSVTGVLLVAKLLGFVKQIIVANAFGPTAEADIINLSQGIITDFEFIIVQTMITAFIPIYISVRENSNIKVREEFVSNVIKLFFVIALVISSIVFIFAPFISKIIAPSYSGEMSSSLSYSIRLYAFALVVYVFIAIFSIFSTSILVSFEISSNSIKF